MSSIPLTRIDSQTILLSEQYLEVSPEKWFFKSGSPETVEVSLEGFPYHASREPNGIKESAEAISDE